MDDSTNSGEDASGGTDDDADGDASGGTTGDIGGDVSGGTDGDISGDATSGTDGGASGDATGGTDGDASGDATGGTTDSTGGETPNTPSQPTDQEKMTALVPYLNSTSVSMKKGESLTLSVGVKTNEYPYTIKWNSSTNNSVVTVDGNGKLTAQGAGSAEISVTVTVGNISNTLKCTVSVADYKIKTPPRALTFATGNAPRN